MKAILPTTIFALVCVSLVKAEPGEGISASPSKTSDNAPYRPVSEVKNEQEFVTRASSFSMAEVQMAQLAQERGLDARVREFGKLIASDHGKVNAELMSAASRTRAEVAPQLESDHLRPVEKVMNADAGKDFDKEFADAMVDSHKDAIDEFEDASREVQNPVLKEYIDSTLPVLKVHFEQAKILKESLKE